MIRDWRHSEMTLTATTSCALCVYSDSAEGRLGVITDGQFQPKAAANDCLQNMS